MSRGDGWPENKEETKYGKEEIGKKGTQGA